MVFRKVQKALIPNGESFLSFCALHLHSTSGVRNHLMKRAFDKTLRQLPPKRPSAFCGLGLRARTMAMTITVFIAVCPCPRLEGPAMCVLVPAERHRPATGLSDTLPGPLGLRALLDFGAVPEELRSHASGPGT